jgi:hypothetical protein
MSHTERNILIAIIALIILWLLRQQKVTTSVTAKVNGVPVTPAQASGSLGGPTAEGPDANNTPPGNNQFNNAGFSQPITNAFTPPNLPPPTNNTPSIFDELRLNDAEF